MSNYRRADTPAACYFFTVVAFRRRNILTDDDSRVCLRNALSPVGWAGFFAHLFYRPMVGKWWANGKAVCPPYLL